MYKQANPKTNILKAILLSPLAPLRIAGSAATGPINRLFDPVGKGRSWDTLKGDPATWALGTLGLGIDAGALYAYNEATKDPNEERLEQLGEALAPASNIMGFGDLDKKHAGLATAAILAAPVVGTLLGGKKGLGQGTGAAAGSLVGYHAGRHLGDMIVDGDLVDGLNKDQKALARIAAIAGTTALGGLTGINVANKFNNGKTSE